MIEPPVKHHIGDEVYHRCGGTDMGIVVGITFRPGAIVYEVQWTRSEIGSHYDLELATEPNYSTRKDDED